MNVLLQLFFSERSGVLVLGSFVWPSLPSEVYLEKKRMFYSFLFGVCGGL